MATLTIEFQSSDGGASLKGASFTLADASTGEVVYSTEDANSSITLCSSERKETVAASEHVAVPIIVEGLKGGQPYVLAESVAPSLSISTEGEDGRTVTRTQRYRAVSSKRFHVLDTEAAQSLIVRHDPVPGGIEYDLSGEEGRALRPSLLRAPSMARALAKEAGWRALPAAVSQMAGSLKKEMERDMEVVRRETEPTPRQSRKIGAVALLGSAAIVALGTAVLAPLGLCIAVCLAGVPAEGFGAKWALESLAAYVQSYLFDGWTAYGLLSSAYPQLAPSGPLFLVAGWLPTALILAWALNKLSLLFSIRVRILEDMPEAIKRGEDNYGVEGSSRLVRDKKEIGRVKGVSFVRANDNAAGLDGIYAGFFADSRAKFLMGAMADALLDGVELGVNAARGTTWGKHQAEDDRWRAPQRLRPHPKGTYAMLSPESHTAVFGDTGAGKTRKWLLTQIVCTAKQPGESMIIFDPKGELYGYCAAALRAMGIDVYVVDLSDPLRSHCWSIVENAAKMWNVNETEASQLAADVVDLIAPKNDKEANAKYFNDGARALITSVLLYMISSNQCPDAQKTMATVARIIADFCVHVPCKGGRKDDTFVPYEVMLEKLGVDHPAYQAYSGARNAGPTYLKNFASTAATFLTLFTSPTIEAMSGRTDCPMEKLANERCAVFLTIPANKTTYKPFALMYLQQAYSDLTEIARTGSPDSGTALKLKQRVNFFCEEICSIPRWPGLANATNIARGYGIRFFLIIQNKSLFDALYEDESNAILGNCTTKIFLSTGDVENTARYFSALLGNYTAKTVDRTLSGSRLSPVKMQESVRNGHTQRAVLNSDEIARWSANYGAIVLIKESLPLCIPLPDVSRTPTQPLLGMGDERTNLELIYNSRLSRPKQSTDLGTRWSPELKQLKSNKAYTAADKLKARKKYMAELEKEFKAGLEGVSGGNGAQGKKGPVPGGTAKSNGLYVGFINQKTGGEMYNGEVDGNLIAMLNKLGAEYYSDTDKKKVEGWLEEKKAEQRDKQTASALKSGRNSKTF